MQLVGAGESSQDWSCRASIADRVTVRDDRIPSVLIPRLRRAPSFPPHEGARPFLVATGRTDGRHARAALGPMTKPPPCATLRMSEADHGAAWMDPDQAFPDLAWALRTADRLRTDLDRILLAVNEGRPSGSFVTDHLAAFVAISHYGVELEAASARDPLKGHEPGLVEAEDGPPAPPSTAPNAADEPCWLTRTGMVD
jgi:hypothetical protein